MPEITENCGSDDKKGRGWSKIPTPGIGTKAVLAGLNTAATILDNSPPGF